MRIAPLLLLAGLAACSDQPIPSGGNQAAPVPAPKTQAAEPAASPVPPPAKPPAEASLPEAPFTETSAQGAATVVETFYALAEAGKRAQAARLLSSPKAMPEPGGELHAEVFAPGEIEGAAGSLYVEVPVREYGRDAAGKLFSRRGKAVLRRVNDVPGSTAGQRRWHIERFEF